MKKNKQLLVSVTLVLVLLLITAGVSVAFFSYVKEGTTENSIKLGTITFKYTENNTLGNGITITDAFPTSDEQGKIQTGEGNVFDFTIESTLSRSDLEYEVVAEPTEDSTLPLDAIKFYLTDISSGTEVELDSSINDDGSVKTLAEYSDTLITNATGKTIYQETILRNTKGYLKEFRARMWIAEDIDWSNENYMGKSTSVKVNVYANSERDMASAETTTPVDTSLERVTANNMYLFKKVEETVEEYQYSLTVPNEVDTLDVDAIPSNTEATVEVTKLDSLALFTPTVRAMSLTNEVIDKINDFTLDIGDNFFKVVVTSSDKTKTQNYILKVTREESNNTGLNSLEVEGYTLVPSYTNSENLYEVEVPYATTSVTINAEKAETTQTITGLGEKELNVGTNEFKIIVMAENGATRTIKITINRRQSADASINNVGVKGYTLTNLEDNIYYVTVPYSVESIEIQNTSTTNATVTGTGIKENLIIGNNDYEVEVTSGDGTLKKTYIIRIVKQQDLTNTLSSLSLTNCTLSPAFESEIISYSCTVPNSVTSTIVSATATSSVATVSGTGSKTLNVGNNTVEVVVTSQSGSEKTYTVVVKRLPNSDATLKSLTLSSGTLSPTFNSATLSYTVSVPYGVDSITLAAEATQSVSNIEGTGAKALSVGENTFEIKVTAQDGTTKETYTVVVTRQKDNDTSLKSLNVANYQIVKVDNNHYTLTVANTVTSVVVNAEATSSVAIVSGTGSKTLKVGDNTVDVIVTAQDNTISVYQIVITRLASSDATLKSLTLSSGTLSPTFASGTTSYTATVPYSVTSITVTPTVNNSEATYTVSGNTSLKVGSNTVTVKVTAGDGTTKTYTITVTRSKDTTATLSGLSLTGCTLSPTFASGTTSYTCTVENTVTSTTVSATATSGVSTVTGTGAKSLSVGSNTVSVKVTAQDGTTSKTYTVTVTRKASSDATLKSLTLSSGTLSPTFASGTTSYTATVPYSVTSLTVTPTVNNSEATYTVSGNTSLKVGSNTVTVKVTAGDRTTTKTYTITVTRSKDSTATLSSLSVTNYSISPTFASATTSYTLTVEASSVVINATATSSVATVTGTGTKNLSWGSNTASVIVTAQDGTVKTYVITITNKQPTAPTITGGSSNWVSTAPTIKVATVGSAISGIKHYEYYKSTSSTTPTELTTATGTTSGNLTVSDEGTTYVWYRTVSNNGFKSNWSNVQVVNLDNTNPKVVATVTGNIATLTLTDNFSISGYGVNQSTATQPTYTAVSGTNATKNWTASSAGTYVAWVRDSSGRTSYAQFTIAETAFCAYDSGYTWEFAYTGDIQEFVVPCTGTYKLEVYGAQGGNSKYSASCTGIGGLGGYSYGNKTLSSGTKIYVVVGGQGTAATLTSGSSSSTTITGGYNGGGTGTSYVFASGVGAAGGSGGGATHMAINQGLVLSSTTASNLLIVAGGGGGGSSNAGWPPPNYSLSCTTSVGGTGGGTTGGSGGVSPGGSQTSGGSCTYCNSGSYGTGGNTSAHLKMGGAGGGGGYYGGAGGYFNNSTNYLQDKDSLGGGGGSGYIGGVTSGSMSNGVREGNGYAKITLISIN